MNAKPSPLMTTLLWLTAFAVFLAASKLAVEHDVEPAIPLAFWGTFSSFFGAIGALFRRPWHCALVGVVLFWPLVYTLVYMAYSSL